MWQQPELAGSFPQILSEPNEELTTLMREIVGSQYAFMLQIDQRIRAFDKEIDDAQEAFHEE